MIANECAIPFQLITSEMVSSLSSDNYFESFEGQTKIFSHDIDVINTPFKDLLEPINAVAVSNNQHKLESNLSIQEQNYDVNLAFHMSPNVQLMAMPPPPPHNIYTNGYNSNNNITIKHNRRNGWKNHSNIPKGYDSDESNKSYSSRDNLSESDSKKEILNNNSEIVDTLISLLTGTKSKISRNGYKFPYEHATIYSNYRYNNNFNSMFCNTLPITHHSTNSFNRRYVLMCENYFT